MLFHVVHLPIVENDFLFSNNRLKLLDVDGSR